MPSGRFDVKLDAVKFGLAAGIIYGAMFFLYALLGALFGVGGEMLKMIGDFYPGVSPTYPGAIIGAAWGFAIGFFFFTLMAWIYNRLLGGD